MKQLSQYIQEKLHVGQYKKQVNRQLLEDWNIQKAEDGDFVQWNSSDLYFIYKCLNEGKKYVNTYEDSIVYHAAYDFNTKHLTIGPETGVGDIKKPDLFTLASVKKKEEFIKVLEDNSYEWDDDKKELIKK